MIQTVFGRLLDGLCIGETGLGCILLAQGIQQLVIGLLDLVDHLAMCVIKSEVRRQEFRPGPINSARPGAEVKDRIIEIQYRLVCLDVLNEELVSEKNILAIDAGLRGSDQRREQFAPGNAQGRGLGSGAFPGQAGLRIVRFR